MKEVVEADYAIDDRDAAQDFFTRLISLYRNLNYSPDDSAEYARYLREIQDLVDSKRVKVAEADEDSSGAPNGEAEPVALPGPTA